ncbi:uncharacterized protein LOC135155936 [Lytechinus pictus]|uniref:uncharacterized protein LOC135155936 n=1 Tax=Lytechinus pictus TaxID=7653 RepID=UPI0030BA0627
MAETNGASPQTPQGESDCVPRLSTAIADNHDLHDDDDISDYGLKRLFEFSIPVCTTFSDMSGDDSGQSCATDGSYCMNREDLEGISLFESRETVEASQQPQCRICLDKLKDGRRLACDHCFCRTCLEDHQKSNCPEGNVTCPLCRRDTDLEEGQVEGLPAVHDSLCITQLTTAIEDHHDLDKDNASDYGLERLFEYSIPVCTMCPDADDAGDASGESCAMAVSYCRDCEEYMCDLCLSGHKRMSKLFMGHTLVSVQDARSGSSPIGAERCNVHKMETINFYCGKCDVFVCQKCVVAEHDIRNILKGDDIRLERRQNIDALTVQVNKKRADMQRYIKNIEGKRRVIKQVLSKVLEEITEAYEAVVRCLEERKTMLVEGVRRVEHECDDEINDMRDNVRCRIVNLSRSCKILEQGRHGCLEADALQAHICLCEEIKTKLNVNCETNRTEGTLDRLQRNANAVKFTRVNNRIVFGHLQTSAAEAEQPLQINKLVSLALLDDGDEKDNHRESNPLHVSNDNDHCADACNTLVSFMNDIPVTKITKPPPFWLKRHWTMIKLIKCPYSAPTCLATRSPESVVVGYWDDPATEMFLGDQGHTDFLPRYSARSACISFLQNIGTVMLYRDSRIVVYNPDGIITDVRFLTIGTPWCLDTDENNIYILTRSGNISAYPFYGGRPLRTFNTGLSPFDIHIGCQCCVVRSETKVVVLSLHDGSIIWKLETDDHQERRVAVDKESDILYVASSQQELDGLSVCLRSFNLCDGSPRDSFVLHVASGNLVGLSVMSPVTLALCTTSAIYIFKKDCQH